MHQTDQKRKKYVTPSCCHRNAPVRKETEEEKEIRQHDQMRAIGRNVVRKYGDALERLSR